LVLPKFRKSSRSNYDRKGEFLPWKIRRVGWEIIFLILSRLRGKATKENTERTNKSIASESKVKVLGFYWALGRYDTVLIAEAPDEKTMMKMLL